MPNPQIARYLILYVCEIKHGVKLYDLENFLGVRPQDACYIVKCLEFSDFNHDKLIGLRNKLNLESSQELDRIKRKVLTFPSQAKTG